MRHKITDPAWQEACERIWAAVDELGSSGVPPTTILGALGHTIAGLSRALVESGEVSAEKMRDTLTRMPLVESFDAMRRFPTPEGEA